MSGTSPAVARRALPTLRSAPSTLLGNLKTSLSGTYHAFGFQKYADRYLAQIQYLFNHSRS